MIKALLPYLGHFELLKGIPPPHPPLRPSIGQGKGRDHA